MKPMTYCCLNVCFFFGFLTYQISQSFRLSLTLINLATDLLFIFGFPASYVRLKNILKSPPSITFLRCKSVISSKRLQRIDWAFRCSDSLLALYRLISKKSLSVSHLRWEFCLIHLIFYLRIHNSYYLWNQ